MLKLRLKQNYLLSLLLSLAILVGYVLLFVAFAFVVKVATVIFELLQRGVGYG